MTLQAAKTLQYKIETRQCTDCASENSSGGGEPWRAVVQLRQHVDHKRTLLALEQKSLDRKMLESCLGESCRVYMHARSVLLKAGWVPLLRPNLDHFHRFEPGIIRAPALTARTPTHSVLRLYRLTPTLCSKILIKCHYAFCLLLVCTVHL